MPVAVLLRDGGVAVVLGGAHLDRIEHIEPGRGDRRMGAVAHRLPVPVIDDEDELVVQRRLGQRQSVICGWSMPCSCA